MGRIEDNCWSGVKTYNKTGKDYNKKFSDFADKRLSMVEHSCFNGKKFKIYNPKEFIDDKWLFTKNIGVNIDSLLERIDIEFFDRRCIFCIDLEQDDLDKNMFTKEEEKIIEFYRSLREQKDNSTVGTTKTLFAWWPDLFIPLDRTHNYNSIVFELQTYGIDLPINRSNQINDKFEAEEYVKVLRGIQFQLHRWLNEYGKSQVDLRGIDKEAAVRKSPFLRVVDKNYW